MRAGELDAATEAAEQEGRAWRKLRSGEGWIVTDEFRPMRPPGPMPAAASIARHWCLTEVEANHFITRQVVRAALEAAEAARGE